MQPMSEMVVGQASQRLLVFIAQAFGAEMHSFGAQLDGSEPGAIDGLTERKLSP